jgi:adenosylcobinamide-GDP ribazoletransferase
MRLDGPRLAVTLLTAIPLPARAGGQTVPPAGTAGWRTAMAWAPAVGLALGAAAAGVLYLVAGRLQAGSLLGAALAIAALALLSRGLHLDGLADLADGLGSGRPAPAALDIMRRPDIGPFGVMTLVLTLLIQVAALARADGLGRGYPALLTAGVASRLAFTWACRRGVPAARPDGLGAMVAGTVHPVTALLLTLAAAGLATPFGWIFPAALAVGLAVSLGVAQLAVHRLGGVTGDVLGAVAEIAVAVCLIVTAIR